MKKILLITLLVVVTGCYDQREIPIEKLTFWHDLVREARYTPDDEWFVNKNGDKRFTRAIYGTNTGFRFETSDYPEFGLYMPNLGGSVYLALTDGSKSMWIKDAEYIESRFRSGERIYTIRDKNMLGSGTLIFKVLALSDADGLVLKTEGKQLPGGLSLLYIYGGASNIRFSREGDIGADPFDSFWIKPQNCENNFFEIDGNRFTIYYGAGTRVLSVDEIYENASQVKAMNITPQFQTNARKITGVLPPGSSLSVGDANKIDLLDELLVSKGEQRPVLIANAPLANSSDYFSMLNPDSREVHSYDQLAEDFRKGETFREQIASRFKINTPDPYFNTIGGMLSGAEDGVWEYPSYLHGAIGWRTPLTGWRASYLGDLMGLHERARTHFKGYAAAQVTDVPVTLPHAADTAINLARSDKTWGTPMYSNGYITRSPNRTDQMHHYNMNLVYIDQLLWHLLWTGDKEYAREVFPVIKRHLAWEKKLFDPDDDALYDGYACIWASDAVQYNGGVATHSTAYNYRSNLLAARIAEMLGEDGSAYRREAGRILEAMNKTLWLPELGHWAEFKDNMGHRLIHPNAAIWSIYHAIDSYTATAFQAYEATRYVDTEIPHIPVHAIGLNDTTNYVIGTTNWQPYLWSINNVAFAEITHTALAFWQAGRKEEAFKMYKGAILDAMYLGSGPGNITQLSFYDAARRETYRDFSDCVATGTRALVYGMYGIVPDLLEGRVTIRPGFPAKWDYASLESQNFAYDFKRRGATDYYTFVPKMQASVHELILEVDARRNKIASVKVNGTKVSYNLMENAITQPKIAINCGSTDRYEIEIAWAGREISDTLIEYSAASDDVIEIALPWNGSEVYDPQSVLKGAILDDNKLTGTVAGAQGVRTLFVKVAGGDMKWWLPVSVEVKPPLSICNDGEAVNLHFTLTNHSKERIEGKVTVNGSALGEAILAPGGMKTFEATAPTAVFGTNVITIGDRFRFEAINWNIANDKSAVYETVDMKNVFNDRVRDIFAYGKYLSPRWQFTTLQVPTQGMGQWCHPMDLSKINDNGIRTKAGLEGQFVMPQGIPFATPGGADDKNILFTTLWDNYPSKASFPLSGHASHIYLLVAAQTYHMQARILNGHITVTYTDGSQSTLNLVLPENLIPLDQDIFIDDYAFFSREPRPYRVRLQTGDVSKNHAQDLGKRVSNNPIYVEGGMATALDLPLDKHKELATINVETIANEVIIGLMAATLVR